MVDQTKALEALKKGDFDILPMYTAKLWAEQTDFPQAQKNWVVYKASSMRSRRRSRASL
jgi:ABC-type oligopeptide transport system substrate-binding subunit